MVEPSSGTQPAARQPPSPVQPWPSSNRARQPSDLHHRFSPATAMAPPCGCASTCSCTSFPPRQLQQLNNSMVADLLQPGAPTDPDPAPDSTNSRRSPDQICSSVSHPTTISDRPLTRTASSYSEQCSDLRSSALTSTRPSLPLCECFSLLLSLFTK